MTHATGNEEEVEKYSRRLVKVLPQHNEDCKTLLTLMGVPHITVRIGALARAQTYILQAISLSIRQLTAIRRRARPRRSVLLCARLAR
jgi:hypothetical protein